MTFLAIQALTKRFGGVKAVDNCTVTLDEKTVVGLIGPNGAGKTTLINLISGIYRPDGGHIFFKDEKIDGMKPHEVVIRGIARTFQLERVFRRMTVLDNLIVPGLRTYEDREKLLVRADELLQLFSLQRLRNEFAGNLSGGQKKLLDVARALMSDPGLMLLDEPFHGVHPELKQMICDNVMLMNRERSKSFVIVSHDMPSLMSLCQRVIVLNAGRLIADGPPQQIREEPAVLEAYLGA